MGPAFLQYKTISPFGHICASLLHEDIIQQVMFYHKSLKKQYDKKGHKEDLFETHNYISRNVQKKVHLIQNTLF